MKPDPAAPADPLNLLRQQLILAQVRIMELEDTRDELAPKLAELEQLLAASQTLTDRKIDEAAHLEKMRADLQAQFEHMRHMQHVTNEALTAVRAEVDTRAAEEENLLSEVENLQILARQLAEGNRQHLERIARLEASLGTAQAETASRLARINELDAEQRAMKSSRSWRWTAWLRSLERALGDGRKP
jgi:chromosome segregation ATPase